MLHDAAPKQTRLQQWLRIDSQQKPKVYAQIFNTAEIYNLNYWLEIVLSAGIAALGLVLNSPAVIIGAMLISPLMGPIMAAGLALAAGDLYLAVKAIASLAASVSLAVAFFCTYSLAPAFPFYDRRNIGQNQPYPARPRCRPVLRVGWFRCGLSLWRRGGCHHFARGGDRGRIDASALHHRLRAGSGANTRIMGGAGLLFLTNLVAIVASAFVVFLLTGMNAPEVRADN